MSDSEHQPHDTSGSGSEVIPTRITLPPSTSTSTALSMSVHFSSGKDNWETPDDLFRRLHAQYNFILDAAANGTNHKLPRWFGPDSPERVDALEADWPLEEGNIWLNPPYSRGLQAKFIQKAVMETQFPMGRGNMGWVVCLLPARTDTNNFHGWIKPYAESIEFLRGRLKFKGGNSCAPFPSMIVVF